MNVINNNKSDKSANIHLLQMYWSHCISQRNKKFKAAKHTDLNKMTEISLTIYLRWSSTHTFKYEKLKMNSSHLKRLADKVVKVTPGRVKNEENPQS